jgi:hypothetical protein
MTAGGQKKTINKPNPVTVMSGVIMNAVLLVGKKLSRIP